MFSTNCDFRKNGKDSKLKNWICNSRVLVLMLHPTTDNCGVVFEYQEERFDNRPRYEKVEYVNVLFLQRKQSFRT